MAFIKFKVQKICNNNPKLKNKNITIKRNHEHIYIH